MTQMKMYDDPQLLLLLVLLLERHRRRLQISRLEIEAAKCGTGRQKRGGQTVRQVADSRDDFFFFSL